MGSLLDSFLALFGPDGVEIASNDIANGLDSLIDYTIPMEGEYTLRIRDLRYKGGEAFVYRLSIGELPYLDSIFPLGGRRGTENTIAVSWTQSRRCGVNASIYCPKCTVGCAESAGDDTFWIIDKFVSLYGRRSS